VEREEELSDICKKRWSREREEMRRLVYMMKVQPKNKYRVHS